MITRWGEDLASVARCDNDTAYPDKEVADTASLSSLLDITTERILADGDARL